MRYRPLDALGDYTVGQPFLANSPEVVAQAISTRLKLWKKEWFLDTRDGTPYDDSVLGKRSNKSPESAIKQRILATPGVISIASFSSSYDGNSRLLTINAVVNTQYGPVTVSEVL